jgi:hypothetical protein
MQYCLPFHIIPTIQKIMSDNYDHCSMNINADDTCRFDGYDADEYYSGRRDADLINAKNQRNSWAPLKRTVKVDGISKPFFPFLMTPTQKIWFLFNTSLL